MSFTSEVKILLLSFLFPDFLVILMKSSLLFSPDMFTINFYYPWIHYPLTKSELLLHGITEN